MRKRTVWLVDLLAKGAVFAIAPKRLLRAEDACEGTSRALSAPRAANSRRDDVDCTRLSLWIRPGCRFNVYGRYRRRFLRDSFHGNSGSCTSS
jgi:hypothetical protein